MKISSFGEILLSTNADNDYAINFEVAANCSKHTMDGTIIALTLPMLKSYYLAMVMGGHKDEYPNE